MAKKSKTKKVIVENVSAEDFHTAFEEFASASALEKNILSEIELETIKIREKFQADLATLKERQEKAFEQIQVYCTEQKDVMFAKKKSMDLLLGTVGFRTSTPSMKTLKGFTWPAVVALLQEFAPKYTRKVIEANKEKLLEDREVEGIDAIYKKCGVECVQPEVFFVNLNEEKND